MELSRLHETAYIAIHGEDAKEHAVFRELTRVRQYFQKIQRVEHGGNQQNGKLKLDKEATGRIIKHSLVCIHVSKKFKFPALTVYGLLMI
jgi:hypothetical protein